MTNISLNAYCPRSKYGLTAQDLIEFAVQVEDQLNEEYTKAVLPPYKKETIKWTPASIVGFAGNCFKSILP